MGDPEGWKGREHNYFTEDGACPWRGVISDRPAVQAGTPKRMGLRQVPSESGWIATFSKPRFQSSIKLTPWSQGVGASHDRTLFCNIRHRDRPLRHRLGTARHQRGPVADVERGQDP